MNDTEIMEQLAEPFEADAVHWKPQSVRENRALAIAYINARDVMDRLDQVVGVGGWADEYQVLPDGNVVCTLSLLVETGWISKSDVGGPSEQPDDGDKMKAAFSDALKRAAVKFGVGRYLYSLGHTWVDYDPKKKALVKNPTLPAWALPKPKAPAAKPAANGTPKSAASPPPPANGKELVERLKKLDRTGADLHYFKPEDLSNEVRRAAEQEGWPENPEQWERDQIDAAISYAKDYFRKAKTRFEELKAANSAAVTT